MPRIFYLFVCLAFVSFSCSKKLVMVKAQDYGAIGDGITDDTKALQAAIDNTGRDLILEPKEYKISSALRLKSNMSIQGNGATFVISDRTKFIALNIQNARQIELKNFKIKGSKNVNKSPLRTSRGGFLIWISESNDIRISGLSFEDHAYSAIHLSDVTQVKIDSCVFSNLGLETSKQFKSYSYDAIFIGGYRYSSDIEIYDCDFNNIGGRPNPMRSNPNDGDGIQIQTPKENSIENVSIRNCTFLACSARGIKLMSGNQITIAKNKFIECGTGVGISMANNVNKVLLGENHFERCTYAWGTNAMVPCLANEIRVENNTARHINNFYRTSGKSRLTNSKIIDNTVDSIGTFFINGKMDNTTISGNTISNYALDNDRSLYMAILVVASSNNVVIRDNDISTSAKTKTAIYAQDNVNNLEIVNNKLSISENEYGAKYLIKSKKNQLNKNKVRITPRIKQE